MTRSIAPAIACCVVVLALAVFAAMPVVAQDEFVPSAGFEVRLCPQASEFRMTLFSGTYESALSGSLFVSFDDSIEVKRESEAEVPVALRASSLRVMTPFSFAPKFKVTSLVIDPKRPSVGVFNTETNEMWINVYVTTAKGNLPVPMPVLLVGTFEDGYLSLSAAQGPIDAGVELHLEGAVFGDDWTAGGESAVPSDDQPVCRPMIETGG